MEHWEEFEGGTQRAHRFPLEFPLHYRAGDDVGWKPGRGANISRSGLLFHAGQPLRLRAPIEVTFVMPSEIGAEPPATVVCQGHVVRLADANGTGGVAVAATIETYSFQATPPLSGR
jgi:PilZ domain